MIVKPRVRGFICTTAHPIGCAEHVRKQITYVKNQIKLSKGPKRVLVIGSSTGYGLASRIVATYASDAETIGVFFERPATKSRPATAGWYNSAAFEEAATADGYYAKSFNGDAFSNELKEQVIQQIKQDWGTVDLVVYSLAAPKRKHPETGEVFSSVIKPIGKRFTSKTVDFQSGVVSETSIEPASEEEIEQTIAVMGGEDWEMWLHALAEADVLAEGAKTVAYSYIGPELTHDIYRTGTIGKAKDDLEQRGRALNHYLQQKCNGRALVSVNKAVVTQASAAIPVVPLYISLLYGEMKKQGVHEDCIEQMFRLYQDRLYRLDGEIPVDSQDRIRIDDLEMKPEIQQAVEQKWEKLTTENIEELSDIEGYRRQFLRLFGFAIEGVDYEQDVAIAVPIKSIPE
ncbi:enoyl-[acyl-carrier protein] reductase / trans-2-enoyl-CoA reductase (NAD+) [Seinonella peptonophila]|uniref:Trans-2-enoyl-CoA reductase [NADH] n=1 Tax=Seinonella peptonophila TaxID=112248 RepID=A0A1M4WJ08_9BACL|nr:enoyl-ACP reductase FabV [Seinonella peptonophila]SHE81177.1 enoyl-[acyl-carrier protein] reductase / trans-2-enoyl-CoA reductase (NAD+) [Seinonella peptonophila]